MARTAVARRYAKALFQIAREDDAVQAVRLELDRLHDLTEEVPELREALFRPLYPVAQRRAALNAVAERIGSSASVKNFYAFLIDQRRIVNFAAIREEFARLADEAEGRVPAQVVSATPLSDAQQEHLRTALSARTGREIQLEVAVDEHLIGGVVARVGDVVFDGSIRTHLHQLRSNLMKGH